MLELGDDGRPSDDHESFSTRRAGQGQDSVWNLADVVEAEPAKFVDGKPGEGYGMLENVPGAVGFAMRDAFPEEGGLAVHSPITHASPWIWVCRLGVTYEDGSRASFTGWLASPRTVITSGRCLYDHAAGPARQVEVAPARDGALSPWGRLTSSDFRIVKGWARSQDPACDYGAVILPGAGLRDVGHFGFAWLPGARPEQEVANQSGYPAGLGSGTQWYEAFRLVGASDRFLYREGGFASAAPGSPIWLHLMRRGRSQRYVCGMVGSAGAGSGALRLHRDVFENIERWIEEAPSPKEGPPEPPADGKAQSGAGTSEAEKKKDQQPSQSEAVAAQPVKLS